MPAIPQGHNAESTKGLKVLIMMDKIGLVPLVDLLAGFLHILGHAWWATAEHPDLLHLKARKRAFQKDGAEEVESVAKLTAIP